MRPTPIDMTTWPRRAHFEHYRRSVPCSYALTVDLDVTALVAALRTSGRRSYVAHTWALATVVNRHDELRMCLTDDGGPATWPVSHPMVTVLDPDRETFSALVLPYEPDFATFHAGAVEILEQYRSSAELFPQGAPPPNTFDVSSLPWTSFTGFSLQIRDGWDHLAPILTLGRYREAGDRTLMPVAVQIHHAAADGFHTGRFLNEVEELFGDPSWLGRPTSPDVVVG